MRAFTDKVPLRTTVVWGGFKDVRAIPHRYGKTAGELLQYDTARRLFVWADHPVQGVDQVSIDGAPATGWTAYNAKDSSGAPVAFVEFTAPVDVGATVVATGRGKPHARTGALIENPADAMWDLLANVCGNLIAESDLDRFRVEAQRLGLAIAGSVSDADATIQSQCGAIAGSVGAIFSARMEGLARVFPGGSLEGYASPAIDYRSEVTPQASLSAIANAVVIRYDWQDGEPKQSIELEAPESVRRYQRRTLAIDATWVADGRVAHAVAVRALEFSARPQWTITAGDVRGVVRPGQLIAIDHPASPYAGNAIATSADVDLVNERSQVTIIVAVGAVPRIALVRQSQALAPVTYSSVGVRTQGDSRVVVIQDETGAPLANARVVLDGQYPRISDAGGVVTFPVSIMPVGRHTLAVTTPGGSFEAEVIIP